jgi:hypothetical protein
VGRLRALKGGAITQRQWNEEAAAVLGVVADNAMGRTFADLRLHIASHGGASEVVTRVARVRP